MALTEKLQLLLDFRADGAVREMQRVSRTSDKELGKAEDRIERLGHRFTKVGAGMMATGGIMAAGFWQAGQAAGDFGESVSKAEQVFGAASSSMVAFAEDTDRLLMSKNNALEAASSFGILAQSLGYTQGQSADMAKELTTLAADLASLNNANPDEVVVALGAAMRGESEPIRRFGVMLDDASVRARAVEMGLAATAAEVDNAGKAQARYAIIMEQTTVAQGDAVRTGDSLANQQKKLAADFENLKIEVGQAVVPAMTSLMEVGRGVLGVFDNLSPTTQSLVSKVGAGATAFLLLGGATSMVVGQAIKMRENIGSAIDGVRNLGNASKATKVALGGMAAVGAVAFLYEMEMASRRVTVNLEKLSGATDEQTAEAFRGIEAFKGHGAAMDLFRQVAEGSIGTAQRMRDELAAQGDDVSELDAVLREAADAQVRMENDTGSTAATIAQYATEARDASAETDDLSDATDEQTDSYKDLRKAVDEALKSFEDYFDEQRTGLNLAMDWEEAIDKMGESIAENGRTLDITTPKGRANAQALEDMAEAAIALGVAEYEATGDIDAATAKIDEHRASLYGAMGQLGLTTAQQQEWLEKLGMTPEQVNTAITTSGLDTANARLAEMQSRLNDIAYNAGVAAANTIARIASNAANPGSSIRLFANGGHARPNETIIVGERGPEMLTMPAGGGTITPNHAMRGGGGDTYVTVNVNAGVGDPVAIGQEVTKVLKQARQAGTDVLAAIS